MSFLGLRDIFSGRVGADYCVRSVLFLKSPNNAVDYLIGIHKVAFPEGDKSKKERWDAYPHVKGTPVIVPIREKELSDSNFMSKQADKLSFDISRFTEFLTAYTKADEDIKPIMLHYSMIYLFDFFSRTWLKYGQNWGHGIKLIRDANNYCAKIQESGIFPRAVDAFYFIDQSNLFSVDDKYGIGKTIAGKRLIELNKMRYSNCSQISLTNLIEIYEKLCNKRRRLPKHIVVANPILVGYAILFVISSLSRYYAKDWFKIREDRSLKNKLELLQYDFLYEWTPEILRQTILRKGLKGELSISGE